MVPAYGQVAIFEATTGLAPVDITPALFVLVAILGVLVALRLAAHLSRRRPTLRAETAEAVREGVRRAA